MKFNIIQNINIMNKIDIQTLDSRPIDVVANLLGLEPVRNKCLCPFHDDNHPSLSLDLKRNRYRCFACGVSGDVISLVMKVANLRFPEACQWLASDSGISIDTCRRPQRSLGGKDSKPYQFNAAFYQRFLQQPNLIPEAQRFLYTERRIDKRVVSYGRLTSYYDHQGNPWLVIPYYSDDDKLDNKLIGIQKRNLKPGTTPRFRFPKGAKCSIYNMPIVHHLCSGDQLYIAEGPSDCWAHLSAGHKAIAIPSATTLTKADIEWLQHIVAQNSLQVHMYPDNDEPGEKLFIKLKQYLPGLVRHQVAKPHKDFGDMWKAMG